jgi:hypothetical protein
MFSSIIALESFNQYMTTVSTANIIAHLSRRYSDNSLLARRPCFMLWYRTSNPPFLSPCKNQIHMSSKLALQFDRHNNLHLIVANWCWNLTVQQLMATDVTGEIVVVSLANFLYTLSGEDGK